MNTLKITYWLLFILCAAVTLFLVFPIMPPSDTWMYCASGRHILESLTEGHSVLESLKEPFSFTASDNRWIDHEWLSNIICFLLVKYGGLTSLYVLRSFCLLITFVLIPLFYFKKIMQIDKNLPKLSCLTAYAFFAAVNTYFLSCADSYHFFDARGYIAAYFFMACCFYMLCPFMLKTAELKENSLNLSAKDWILWSLIPVFSVIFASCHGGYIVPLLIMLTAAFILLICRCFKQSLFLAAVVFISFAASSVFNIYGAEILLFPFSLIEDSIFKLGLNEWQRPSYCSLYLYMLAAAYITAFRRLLSWEKIVGFCLLAAAFLVWRHAPLCALGFCFIMLRALMLIFSEKLSYLDNLLKDEDALNKVRLKSRAVLCVLTVLICVSGFGCMCKLISGAQAWTGETRWFCRYAADYLINFSEASKSQERALRICNPYGWGGYLEWRLGTKYKLFIDGRAHTLYSDKTYAQSLLMEGGDKAAAVIKKRGYESLIADFKDQLTLLDDLNADIAVTYKMQNRELIGLLNRDSRWFSVFNDGNSEIFLRNTPEMHAAAEKTVYPKVPDLEFVQAVNLIQQNKLDSCLEKMRLICKDDSCFLNSRIFLICCLWDMNRPLDSFSELLKAVFETGNNSELFNVLAYNAEDKYHSKWSCLYYALSKVFTYYGM